MLIDLLNGTERVSLRKDVYIYTRKEIDALLKMQDKYVVVSLRFQKGTRRKNGKIQKPKTVIYDVRIKKDETFNLPPFGNISVGVLYVWLTGTSYTKTINKAYYSSTSKGD